MATLPIYHPGLAECSDLSQKVRRILDDEALPEGYAFRPRPNSAFMSRDVIGDMVLLLYHYEELAGETTERKPPAGYISNDDFYALFWEVCKRRVTGPIETMFQGYIKETVPKYKTLIEKLQGRSMESTRAVELNVRLDALITRCKYDETAGTSVMADVSYFDLMAERGGTKHGLRSFLISQGRILLEWMAGGGGMLLERVDLPYGGGSTYFRLAVQNSP